MSEEVNEKVQSEYNRILFTDIVKIVRRRFNPKTYPHAYTPDFLNERLRLLKTDALKLDEELTEEQKADPLANRDKFRYNTILKVLNGEDKEKHEKLKEWCEKWGYVVPVLPPGEFEILD